MVKVLLYADHFWRINYLFLTLNKLEINWKRKRKGIVRNQVF